MFKRCAKFYRDWAIHGWVIDDLPYFCCPVLRAVIPGRFSVVRGPNYARFFWGDIEPSSIPIEFVLYFKYIAPFRNEPLGHRRLKTAKKFPALHRYEKGREGINWGARRGEDSKENLFKGLNAQYLSNHVPFLVDLPPCGSGVCVVYQNRPTPFPGWMS